LSRLHKPKAGFWIRLCVAILYPLDALLYRIRWRHLDRVPAPEQGPVIIAINHISHVDTVLMARLVWQTGRVPRFLIKAGVFSKPVLGQIMRGAKQIPVSRGTTDAAQSLEAAALALDAGEAVVIYPEGTISREPSQWPMQGKSGIARLVLLRPDVPVIPVGQWGAQKRPFSPLRPFRRPVSAAIVGEPMDLSRFRNCEPNAATLREITDTIMCAIRDLVAEVRGEPAPSEFFKPRNGNGNGNGVG
jgi:1-acyl-sn-glycerol-3-phosphate acyltransferase